MTYLGLSIERLPMTALFSDNAASTLLDKYSLTSVTGFISSPADV